MSAGEDGRAAGLSESASRDDAASVDPTRVSARETPPGSPPGAADVPGAPLATVGDFRTLFLDGRPLLDVRAPVEFGKGAFPGATNAPLLDDAERHAVGVRYKRRGQEAAIALGAELLGPSERERRTALWKAFAEAHPDGALYCFRGGLRSRIAQRWLADAGVELPLVSGGYKAMRAWLIDALASLCERGDFRLLGGRTGVGKTALLRRLGPHVDLEGIARHRGSSFGALPGPQPGNVDFENRVTIELLRLEAGEENGHEVGTATDRSRPEGPSEHGPSTRRRPLWLEDEARLIGRVCMPDTLVEAMRRAPIVVLETPLERRVANCVEDYVTDLLARHREAHGEAAGFERYASAHRDALDRVRKRLGGDRHRQARELLDAALAAHREHGDTARYAPFVELMLVRYYDPMYDYQLEGKRERVRFAGEADAIVERFASR